MQQLQEQQSTHSLCFEYKVYVIIISFVAFLHSTTQQERKTKRNVDNAAATTTTASADGKEFDLSSAICMHVCV